MRRAEIEQLLPAVFRRAALPRTPVGDLLDIMEALHVPAEDVLEQLDRFFSPHQAPPSFVATLAAWMGLAWLIPGGTDPRRGSAEAAGDTGAVAGAALRALVAEGAELACLRGTGKCLARFLSLATGSGPFQITPATGPDGSERPFAITVTAPPELEPRRGVVAAILRHEKPAYVQCELRFGPEGECLPVTDVAMDEPPGAGRTAWDQPTEDL